MTSAHALALTSQLLQDPAVAVPLLRLLHAFSASRGDPLGEAMTRDVMLFVWTRVEDCEDAMTKFLEEANQSQKAA